MLQERLATLLTKRVREIGSYELHQNHRTNEQAAKLVGAVLD